MCLGLNHVNELINRSLIYCMAVHATDAQGGQGTACRNQFSPSTVGIPEIHTQVARLGGKRLYLIKIAIPLSFYLA